jgi:cysteinyl-tRNA synthetase
VYHFAHIGNLRTYIFEDILRRSLFFAGFNVEHVMNVTDVGHLTGDGDDGEDKMIKAARDRGMSVWDIAEFYTKAFFDDCDKLNIERPEVICTATTHIQDMIDLIQRLEQRGYTYVADGNVYYDISKFAHYNELGLLDRQEQRAGTRVQVDANKRNPGDFVLWFTNSKFKDQAMLWDSPWGRGYPGWHIECSAMSHKYLGDQFDIHCGGVDHIKVHHTNEIAQTEGAYGVHPSVNFWMHGEFLIRNNAKMSKSSGEFLTISRLGELGFDPLDFRYFCLGAHYRTQLAFTDDNLAAARSARSNLVDKIKALALAGGREQTKAALAAKAARAAKTQVAATAGATGQSGATRATAVQSAASHAAAPSHGEDAATLADKAGLGAVSRKYLDVFCAHIADDLNMPRGLAWLFEILKSELGPNEKLELIDIADHVFGLDLLATAEARIAADEANESSDHGFSAEESAEIRQLIADRATARADKNFARSDEIRDLLKARGIVLVDAPSGTTFKRL